MWGLSRISKYFQISFGVAKFADTVSAGYLHDGVFVVASQLVCLSYNINVAPQMSLTCLFSYSPICMETKVAFAVCHFTQSGVSTFVIISYG